MEEELFLKMKNGDVYLVDNFVDLNLFMEAIDGFLEHHQTVGHYTTPFFRLSVNNGNALAFQIDELLSVYLERYGKVDEPVYDRSNKERSETE